MQKLGLELRPADRLQFLTQVVLDGFHIVICSLLDLADLRGLLVIEPINDLLHGFPLRNGKRLQLGNPGVVGQSRQVAELDENTRAHQRFFAEERTQLVNFLAIPSVEGREGLHWRGV